MEQRKQKRYYKQGEVVWVKTVGALGKIENLNVNPQEQIYEATVEIKEGEQKGTVVTVKLWEIDKNRRAKVNKKHQRNAVANKKPTILFAKVAGKENAIIPSKDDENAGYDIYACIENDVIIDPHQTVLIPTGIAASVRKEYALIAKERGSTGAKGMGLRAGVIDSSYRGEIFIAITNENTKFLVITNNPDLYDESVVVHSADKAIAQLILVPVFDAKVKEISYEDLKAIPSKRGEGKLGSSNK